MRSERLALVARFASVILTAMPLFLTLSAKAQQSAGAPGSRQDVPDNLKAQTDSKGEASLRGHLKAEGAEETGSQSYVPPNESDDKAIKMALDLLRGTASNAAFPPNPKAAVPN